MDLNLRGKRALVCGSSQGMGLAIGKELANQRTQMTLFHTGKEMGLLNRTNRL